MPNGQPLARNRQLSGDKGFQSSNLLLGMKLYVVERAHDRWSRVPKNSHLDPVVGDIAMGLMHASPQIVLVIYGRTILERAGRLSADSFGFAVWKPYTDPVTEGAAGIHRKRVLVGLGSRDQYSEG